MKTQPSHSSSRGSGGFTLIEVTLALGVVAFAFVSLMGLLPVGMQAFRSTIDTAVRSQIVQHVTTDATETDFDTLTSGTCLSGSTLLTSGSAYRYFDDQGTEVPQSNSIYQVWVQVAPATQLPAPVSSGSNTNLATLLIQIANNPAHVANPFTSTNNIPPISVATVYVARNEHQ
jgi:uncharacterized protein (TIGR02598 family)